MELFLERHPLFQDNSRLAQLIAHVTGSNEDAAKRVTAAQNLLEYTYDVSHLEVRSVSEFCSYFFLTFQRISLSLLLLCFRNLLKLIFFSVLATEAKLLKYFLCIGRSPL